MSPTRRRGLLLLCFALVCGGLAASQVREHERRVEAAVGPLISVAIARRDVPADRRLTPADLAARRIPARFAPPDALTDPAQLAGARTAVPLAAGAYLTAAVLGGEHDAGPAELRPGERALSLRVAGALTNAQAGARVDVVVATETRTFLALENAELLDLAGSIATLRTTARQAVYLTAAANFARQIRLLVRPPGDRKRIGPAAVGASGR
jgi:pilus assembly protein CpaB